MHYSSILTSLFQRQVRRENSVCASRSSGYRKFLKPHLQNRIEITKKHERHIRPQTDPTHEIDNAR